MLEKSVVEKEKSARGDCWRRVVEKSVVEKSCREVLERSVGEESCRGMLLGRSVGKECWRKVL